MSFSGMTKTRARRCGGQNGSNSKELDGEKKGLVTLKKTKTKMKTKMPKLPRPKPRTSFVSVPVGRLDKTESIPSANTSTASNSINPRSKDASTFMSTTPLHTSDLQSTLLLLDKIYFRNHNQHRAQHWWKFLSLLRKALRQLHDIEMAVNQSDGRTGTAEAVRRKLEREKQLQEKKVEMQSWIREVLLLRCYVAFSGLVADTQFCGIGVVLMGALGGVGVMVGFPKEELKVQSFKGIRVNETGSKRGFLGERVYSQGGVEEIGTIVDEDVGEIIKRRDGGGKGLVDVENYDEGEGEDEDRKSRMDEKYGEKPLKQSTEKWDAESKSKSESTPEAQPLVIPSPSLPPKPSIIRPKASTKLASATTTDKAKKKRKKTNAIDDLFGGLA